jgi:hypothetical protein
MGKQAQSTYSRLFTGRKPQPMEVREAAELQLSKLFKQQQSLQAAPIATLVALEGLMANCECDLVAMTADQEGMRLEINSAANLEIHTISIPGYQLSSTPGDKQDAIILTLVASTGGAR